MNYSRCNSCGTETGNYPRNEQGARARAEAAHGDDCPGEKYYAFGEGEILFEYTEKLLHGNLISMPNYFDDDDGKRRVIFHSRFPKYFLVMRVLKKILRDIRRFSNEPDKVKKLCDRIISLL